MSIPHPFPSVIETSVKDISDYTFLVGIGRRYTRSPIRDEYAYLPSDAWYFYADDDIAYARFGFFSQQARYVGIMRIPDDFKKRWFQAKADASIQRRSGQCFYAVDNTARDTGVLPCDGEVSLAQCSRVGECSYIHGHDGVDRGIFCFENRHPQVLKSKCDARHGTMFVQAATELSLG